MRDDVIVRRRGELDLRDAAAARDFFRRERPRDVIVAAARVGGIDANRQLPAEFIHTNLAIQTAVLAAAAEAGVRRLIFFGSACAYPRDAASPIREDALFTGPVEPTSEAYAVAKLAGIKMCESYNRERGTRFLSVCPPTLYGPGDHVDPERSHVVSALLARFGAAPADGEVAVWGTGRQRRELM